MGTDCRQDTFAGESLLKPFAENQHPRQLFGLTIINTITVNVVWVVGYLLDLCVDGYMKGTCYCTCTSSPFFAIWHKSTSLISTGKLFPLFCFPRVIIHGNMIRLPQVNVVGLLVS